LFPFLLSGLTLYLLAHFHALVVSRLGDSWRFRPCPEETMFIFLEINPKHELNLANAIAQDPHQPTEGMTANARHDGSPQAGRNRHIPAYKLFAEVLTRFIGIEEVPAPLVAEICN